MEASCEFLAVWKAQLSGFHIGRGSSLWNRFSHGAVQIHGHVQVGRDNERIQEVEAVADGAKAESVPELEILTRTLVIGPPRCADG